MVTTRLVALAAVVGIAATAALDFVGSFWVDHPMVTAYVSGLLLIALGGAVLNEVLASRARRRWQSVAGLALIQMRDAIQQTQRALCAEFSPEQPPLRNPTPQDLRQFREACHEVLRDDTARVSISDTVAAALAVADPVAVTWAPVVIADGAYVYRLDEFVSLTQRAWRLKWALSDPTQEDEAPKPTADAIVVEVVDLMVDMDTYARSLSTQVRDMLPWPDSFGPPP